MGRLFDLMMLPVEDENVWIKEVKWSTQLDIGFQYFYEIVCCMN